MPTECLTTKVCYQTYSAAWMAAQRQQQFVYRCQHCGCYHTSKDGRGNVSKNVSKLPVRAVERIWNL